MALMRWKTNYGGGAVLLGLVLSFLTSFGCVTEPDSVKKDTTNVLFNVVKLTAESGQPTGVGTESDFLLSDVCFSDDTHPPCSYFNDNGIVEIRAQLKDATQAGSSMDSVVFERYRVTFVRADGRNVAGVDVPYPFDGAVNFTVPFDASASSAFVVVRHQAKIETPLRELREGGTLISVLAQIDFYGHDLAGRSVQVTGYLNITFGDFGNQ
jgi:hypothetical protein